jgi:son of sevenless-like protein
MLDRLLDRILSDDEKTHPLRLPPQTKYRFAVEDSENNIVFDKDNGNHFVIKVCSDRNFKTGFFTTTAFVICLSFELFSQGATLLKLIERLTHNLYSDPNFINTFLTTYRSFCSPNVSPI